MNTRDEIKLRTKIRIHHLPHSYQINLDHLYWAGKQTGRWLFYFQSQAANEKPVQSLHILYQRSLMRN